jgi:hypothetical protein
MAVIVMRTAFDDPDGTRLVDLAGFHWRYADGRYTTTLFCCACKGIKKKKSTYEQCSYM